MARNLGLGEGNVRRGCDLLPRRRVIAEQHCMMGNDYDYDDDDDASKASLTTGKETEASIAKSTKSRSPLQLETASITTTYGVDKGSLSLASPSS